MTNPLPNPIPAGTVVFVSDGEPRTIRNGEYYLGQYGDVFVWNSERGTDLEYVAMKRHIPTRPLHILTDEQVEAVKKLGGFHDTHADLINAVIGIKTAFAPILDAPKVEERKTPTDEVRMLLLLSSHIHPDYRKAMDKLCDLVDNAIENRRAG